MDSRTGISIISVTLRDMHCVSIELWSAKPEAQLLTTIDDTRIKLASRKSRLFMRGAGRI